MGTGGSRFGAGRPGWHRRAEQSLALDVRRIASRGLLAPGRCFSWYWTTNYGDRAGDIGVRVAGDPERVILNYSWTPSGGDPQAVECSLWINRTPCNYGGTRPWFSCTECGRRCAVVYFGARGGRYACRRCCRVAYLCQSGDKLDRLWRKQNKIERRLSGGAGEWNGWEKPKGMRWRTFERLQARINDIECGRDELFGVELMRRFGKWL